MCETIPRQYSANAVMQCPSCASRIPEGSRFCPTCGAAIPSDASVAETIAIADTPASTPARSQTRPSSLTGSSARTSSEGRFLPGDLVAGRYRVVALLGKGGMGEVYRADDLALGQAVALKFLPEALGKNPASIERFRNEVRLARQVSHPHVCRVYDVGEVEGHPFLSMEYVDGEDLASLLRRIGRLPSDKALEIARGLCAGLAAAHDKGILHRDLKPGNVMIDGRGQVLLTDFGLAGIANEIAGNEVRNGTPLYMAPEQLAGKEVTVRSDIYSLGLLLYELFTGKPPFEAATLADLVRVRSSAPPLSPSTLVRDMDPAVERVILRCLEADPAARPASALAVAAALPGGDPLAAALAAGETPSPEMVAAAGEGTGLRMRVAVPLLAGILIAMAACIFLAYRSSALQDHRARLFSRCPGPEGARHHPARGLRRTGFRRGSWLQLGGLVSRLSQGAEGRADWDRILRDRPPVLRFWYRQSPYPMTAISFHDDHLTPGIVDPDDPPRERSGMINVFLDHRGRLVSFEAIPPQLLDPLQQPAPLPDWAPLFAAAELDPAKLEAAEPLWTFQATSDARTAWTGVWPGTSIPLRVEAASLRGRPTAFVLFGPWMTPWRMPARQEPISKRLGMFILIGISTVIGIAVWLFSRRERGARPGRPSRRAAARIVHRLSFRWGSGYAATTLVPSKAHSATALWPSAPASSTPSLSCPFILRWSRRSAAAGHTRSSRGPACSRGAGKILSSAATFCSAWGWVCRGG
jgi:predicted Ser/Thr protein kinase